MAQGACLLFVFRCCGCAVGRLLGETIHVPALHTHFCNLQSAVVAQMAALAVLSFAVATYMIYMKFTGVLGGLLLGESQGLQ